MTVVDEHLTANYARFPVAFGRGEGVRLWDAEGNEYLDFLCGISVSSVGHCHPAVVAAIQEQAARLIHVGNLFYTEPMTALAGRLARSLGDGSRVFFTNSGAEAVEAALKCARKAKQGGDVVSLQRAFHGRTYGALSATPQEAKQAPFAPLVPGFRACEPTAEAIRANVDDRTAAVILEPVQGEGGVFVLEDEVLIAAREACDAHGACLIFDEVQCGLGRTGTFWHFEQTPVVPDVLTSAKALAGGLPMGAMIAGPAYADVFAPGDHGSTFPGGTVVAAAAHAVLDIVADPVLLARVRDLGERLRGELERWPEVASVRGRGLMLGFDLVAGGAPEVARARAARAAPRGQRDGPGDRAAPAAADHLRRGPRRGAAAAQDDDPGGVMLTGGCGCGAVRFEITEPLTAAAYCHCTRCQRRTGSACSAGGRLVPGTLRLLAGEDQLGRWQPGGGLDKVFCSACGSAVFAQDPDDHDTVIVRLGAVDGDPGVRPAARQFTDYAASWEPIPDDGLPRYPERLPAG